MLYLSERIGILEFNQIIIWKRRTRRCYSSNHCHHFSHFFFFNTKREMTYIKTRFMKYFAFIYFTIYKKRKNDKTLIQGLSILKRFSKLASIFSFNVGLFLTIHSWNFCPESVFMGFTIMSNLSYVFGSFLELFWVAFKNKICMFRLSHLYISRRFSNLVHKKRCQNI